MKHNKRLDLIIDQAVRASFKDGKLLEQQALKLVATFKKMPKTEAIYLISGFLKGLRREMAKHTLIVESATPLSKSELSEVKKKLPLEFTINDEQFTINPKLLAGIRVKIADEVYDLSMKGKLEQLKEVIHG